MTLPRHQPFFWGGGGCTATFTRFYSCHKSCWAQPSWPCTPLKTSSKGGGQDAAPPSPPRGLSHEGSQLHPHPSCHVQTQSTGRVQARGGRGAQPPTSLPLVAGSQKPKETPPKGKEPPSKRGKAGGWGGGYCIFRCVGAEGASTGRRFQRGGKWVKKK